MPPWGDLLELGLRIRYYSKLLKQVKEIVRQAIRHQRAHEHEAALGCLLKLAILLKLDLS